MIPQRFFLAFVIFHLSLVTVFGQGQHLSTQNKKAEKWFYTAVDSYQEKYFEIFSWYIPEFPGYEVSKIHWNCLDFYKHLIIFQGRFWHILNLKYIRGTIFSVYSCFHFSAQLTCLTSWYNFEPTRPANKSSPSPQAVPIIVNFKGINPYATNDALLRK